MSSQSGVVPAKTSIEKLPSVSSNAVEQICFWMSIVLGVLCTWAGKNSISSDGISYLDLGNAYLRGAWTHAANAYWTEEHAARIASLRHEMLPLFVEVESNAPSIHDFFRGFRRIGIVENRQEPLFSTDRLSAYLDLQSQQTVGTLQVISSVPK